MQSLVLLLSLLVGCSFSSNIGGYGSNGHTGGQGYADRGTDFNGYAQGYDGSAYGGNGAEYSGHGADQSGHAQEYAAAGKVHSGADYGLAAGYDKNSHVDELSGYGKDAAHKSFGSYDYKYKAPEYHVESYFSEEKDGKQYGHDARNQGYSDQGSAQQHGSGYGSYDDGYAGSAASGYGQQRAEHGHTGGFGGYGDRRNMAAAGGYGHQYDGYGERAGYGAAIHPAHPYLGAYRGY